MQLPTSLFISQKKLRESKNAPDPSSAAAKHVFELYRRKFATEPKLPLFVAWGYDGVNLLSEAISKVGVDSTKIKDFLYNIKNFPGASADITFNPAGSSPVMEKMFRIKGEKFVLVDSH